jgi:hypothetical protein
MLEIILSPDDLIINRNIWIYYVELVTGIISMIGCLFVIMAYTCYSSIRNRVFELIFYLMISSFFNNLSYIMYYIEEDNLIIANMTLCRAQAFIMIWSEISQQTWALLIVHSVYDKVVNFDDAAESNRSTCMQRLRYIIFGFIYPLSYAIIGLVCDFLGPSGKWCWINTVTNDKFGNAYGFIIYIIIWISIFAELIFTCSIIRFLNKTYAGERLAIVSRFMNKLITYPIINIVCFIPATINRIIFLIFGYIPVFQLFALIFLTLQGFAYAITYGFNPQVRNALYTTFFRARSTNTSTSIHDFRTSNTDSFISNDSSERNERIEARFIDFSL